jgi:hypothetical protein
MNCPISTLIFGTDVERITSKGADRTRLYIVADKLGLCWLGDVLVVIFVSQLRCKIEFLF